MTLQPLDRDAVTKWAMVLAPARQLAEVISHTEFVPKAMRDQPDVVTAAIMYGDEIGVGPMQALVGIHVVEGRPAPSAELMRALILRAGHTLTIHEMSGTRCRVSGLRHDRPEGERLVVEWNLDMARAAGLLGRQVWQRYPRAMLLARATSDLARILFPDVVKGLGYMAEDVSSAEDLEHWAPFTTSDPMPDAPAPRTARPPVQRRTTPRQLALDAAGHGHTDEVRQADPIDQSPTQEDSGGQTTAHLPPDPIDQPVTQASGHAVRPPSAEPPEVLAGEGPPLSSPRLGGGPDLPDLEPEAPPPEPAAKGAGPVPIGDGMRGGLLSAWRRAAPEEANPELNRMRRLEWFSHVTGRLVESSKQLTRAEGIKLAAELGKVDAGEAVMVETPEGWLRIAAWPEPRPTEPPTDEDGPDVWGRSQVELPWDGGA